MSLDLFQVDPKWFEYIVFVTVTGMMFLLLYTWGRNARAVQERIDELMADAPPSKQPKQPGRVSRALGNTVPKMAAKLVPDDESQMQKLQGRLAQAGIYSTQAVYTFFAVRLCLMIAPVAAALVFHFVSGVALDRAMFWGAVGGGAGYLIPALWLLHRKQQRQGILLQSFPDFLDLLVTCVESGLSLDGGFQRVTSELRVAHPVLAGEMERVQREIQLGTPPDVALHNLAVRTDLDAIRSLGVFIQQARRFGTSIAETLRAHSEMLRYQREQRAEEMAQKAAVKVLFPTLLLIFPAVFVVLAGPAAILLSEKFVNK